MQTAIKNEEDEAKAINEIQKGILAISQKKSLSMCLSATKRPITAAEEHRTASLQMTFIISAHAGGASRCSSRASRLRTSSARPTSLTYSPPSTAPKVMVALGTKPEYFNAVWVKNEWSRYLSLVKNSNGKKRCSSPHIRTWIHTTCRRNFRTCRRRICQSSALCRILSAALRRLFLPARQGGGQRDGCCRRQCKRRAAFGASFHVPRGRRLGRG